jgi:release factor glutamine methyltransferase
MYKRKIVKYFLERTYRPFIRWYLSKERKYNYDGLVLLIKPGVFHPGFFGSTGVLLRFLSSKPVKGKNVLELGAGSALISMVLARKGAVVTASDISTTVIENIKENVTQTNISLSVIQSDMFKSFSKEKFDMIIINPPYFSRDPITESEFAWYCGSNFDYFKKLFQQLPLYISSNNNIYMILSEDCEIKSIKKIAEKSCFELKLVHSEKIWFEYNYIFELIQLNNQQTIS